MALPDPSGPSRRRLTVAETLIGAHKEHILLREREGAERRAGFQQQRFA
jgi:hypothetical protein